MSTVDILLSRNLIPILKHSNPWFSFMQEEADRAVRGASAGSVSRLFHHQIGQKECV